MAIFNWTPNSTLPFNSWVSPAGSDANAVSANSPYRTLQKSKDSGLLMMYVAAGVYRELPNINVPQIVAEIGTVIDGTLLTGMFSINNGRINNVLFKNANAGVFTIIENCFLINSSITFSHPSSLYFKSIFKNAIISNHASSNFIGMRQNSYYKTALSFSSFPSNKFVFINNIIHSCDITITGIAGIEYVKFNIFHNCRFKFGTDTVFKTLTELEATYQVVGIIAVRKYMEAKLGVIAFDYCSTDDPLFNNVELNDFTLSPLSPARHMAYDGTYIGAKDVGFPTYAYANDLGYPNAFYNASKHANVIVGNNSITLARNPDGSAVGSGYITEKPKKLGQVYELKGNGSSYMGADRNREMLDVNSDIGDLASPISAGTPLTSGVIYINEGGSVVYNGTTHANRSRITAVDSVQSFTTAEGAVLHAVTEYPNRYTNLIRHKQTIPGTQIAAGTDVLTADSWYRVLTNPITWDGKTIPVDDCFQAVAGKLSFTGTGVCVAEFSAADVWSECIIDAPIKCRRVGNVASGAIDVGTDGKPLTNGHKEYYNTTNKVRAEFSIFAAYVQKHWVLNAKMSK